METVETTTSRPNSTNAVLGAGRIKTWRGEFEILPLKDRIEVGDYYLVDYNRQSHPAAPDKEREVIKVMSTADENGYYRTDRGTQFKSYCIVHRLSPPCT